MADYISREASEKNEMFSDYISRDAAWNGIYNCPTKRDADGYIWVRTIDVAHKIDEIPAADVVEVVRCGECRERTSGRTFCQGRPKDWFCASGARRINK